MHKVPVFCVVECGSLQGRWKAHVLRLHGEVWVLLLLGGATLGSRALGELSTRRGKHGGHVKAWAEAEEESFTQKYSNQKA